MRKGGYRILDFDNLPMTKSNKFAIDGIYEKIESCRKTFLLSGLNLDKKEFGDIFASPTVSGEDFVFKVYGYTITISKDDNVTPTLAA